MKKFYWLKNDVLNQCFHFPQKHDKNEGDNGVENVHGDVENVEWEKKIFY